jgi:hypothetical protein
MKKRNRLIGARKFLHEHEEIPDFGKLARDSSSVI